MIQKKICMLGSFAVGKTSLIARFVHSIFHDRYLTTVGVKIDRKDVSLDEQQIRLIVWDLHGDDEYQRVHMSYLRGASGYFLVADGTRKSTLDQAVSLQHSAQGCLGPVPFILLLNKCDLTDEWEIQEEDLENLAAQGWQIRQTSAKTGEDVDRAFHALTQLMLKGDRVSAGK